MRGAEQDAAAADIEAGVGRVWHIWSLRCACHIGRGPHPVIAGPPLSEPLAPLFRPIASLPGVGPTTATRLAKVAGGTHVRDLLFHLPETYVDRSARRTILDAEPGAVATFAVQVVSVATPERGSNQPWRAIVTDGTATAELPYWGNPPPAAVRPGAALLLSGRIEAFGDRRQVRNPRLVDAARAHDLPPIEPVWPLTAQLHARQVERAMAAAVALLPDLPEWHDPALVRRESWPAFADALRAVQAPRTIPGDAARNRLAYDELLAHQVAMAWVRLRTRRRPGRATAGDGHLRREALHRFAHRPTESQHRAMAEIEADMAAPRRMLRLLQGDVGSGKTLVALMAMLTAVEAGGQAALMAPTEILCKQHHRVLSALSPVPVGLLTGTLKASERRAVLRDLASGALPMVVGTHALFQDAVAYRDLALAVIDEQHRFGVDQRRTLRAKGERSDVLVMTATPIPRSLLLTQYREMELSRLTEKPAGRQPIRTSLHSLTGLDAVVEAVGRMLDRGERAYWVCPMVHESEVSDLAAAVARFTVLQARFGDAVGLAHGQQDPAVRDAALARFASGETPLLVATTVVEVGVDVREASVMVIEHAERFGLAQLHQLRGRVGRGAVPSFCLLLHEDGLTDTMRRRLALLRETEDGFRIADEDFRLRGPGDPMGRRQSGAVAYRMADLERHEDLLAIAAKDAALLLDLEPELDGKRGPAVRLLMTLFDRADAVRTLDAG